MILSLDLASKQSGWAIMEEGKVLGYGIIQPRPLSLKADERLPIIEKELEAVLDLWPKVELAILEVPAGGEEKDVKGPENNWLTMSVLYMVHGVVRNILQKRNISYILQSPSTWVNILGIHKRERYARKQGAKEYVEKTYNITGKEQDVYDAIAIGSCYFEQNKHEKSAF